MAYEQVPIGELDAALLHNTDPRCPVVLLLDNSQSMTGEPLDALNEGLRTFREELNGDALASRRVEVAVVSFGPVRTVCDFTGAREFDPPRLEPAGDTPMGAAVERALELIEVRKQAYRDAGLRYFRPWVFLITDGSPTDDWTNAARLVRERSEKRSLSFFAVAVEDADMQTLSKLSVRPPLRLKGLQFRELFQWLSSSLQAVSGSRPEDDRVPLKDPTVGDSWAST